MKIGHYLLATALFLTGNAFLQAQSLDWATKTADGNSVPYGMAVDAQGNTFLAGMFTGATDFDPGPGGTVLTAANLEDAFVAKFDPAGSLLWAFRFGDMTVDYAHSVAVDAAGDIYVVGRFQDTMDVDPGPGVFSLISPGSGTSGFVAKFTTNGNLVWAADFQAEYAAVARYVTVDGAGHVYVSGTYSDTTDFNGYIYAGNLLVDAFVAKMDAANGNVEWVRGAGSVLGNESARSVVVDAASNVYYAGKFRYTVDFDPGPDTASFTAAAGFDAYCVKLDSTGDFIWARVFEGLGGDDEAVGLRLDATGDLYLAGNFVGTLDADPDTGMVTLSAAGGQDVFVLKMDSAGKLIWAHGFGGTQADECLSIDLDDSTNVYSIGSFQQTVDFDPSPATYNLTSIGVKDVFLHKLDSSGNFQDIWRLGSTSHEYGADVRYRAPGQLYSVGHFQQTLDVDPGAPVYNLTPTFGNAVYVERMLFCSTTTGTFSETACDSFISPSGNYTWTATGTYQDTLTNIAGCDSFITANITIALSTSGTITPVACDSFIAPSGSITYTASGTYTDVVLNAAGCDSILTIQLTIVSVDTGVSQSGITLTANAAVATYQWIDCDNSMQPIPGATQQGFTPSATGSYAVIISENGCTDTSACHTVTVVGLVDGHKNMAINVFPNPAGTILVLEVGDMPGVDTWQIMDPAGRQVLKGNVAAHRVSIDVERLAAGLYMVEAGGSRARFVKQ